MSNALETTPVYLVAARRTPFGKFGGALKSLSATDLGVIAAQASLESASVEASAVDSVIFGNVAQTSADAIYLATDLDSLGPRPRDALWGLGVSVGDQSLEVEVS